MYLRNKAGQNGYVHNLSTNELDYVNSYTVRGQIMGVPECIVTNAAQRFGTLRLDRVIIGWVGKS